MIHASLAESRVAEVQDRLPQIEKILGRPFRDSFSQAEYSMQLRSAHIGLSLFGSDEPIKHERRLR
jgi:hypothetical protein